MSRSFFGMASLLKGKMPHFQKPLMIVGTVMMLLKVFGYNPGWVLMHPLVNIGTEESFEGT